MDPGAALITARSIVKRFGSFEAVRGIDFDVHQGEVFGFLGPNGAGKSSTMRMIGAVSPVTEGTLRLFGLDPATDGKAIRARLGVVPQQDELDEFLTVGDNLYIYGRYFDLPRSTCWERARELLEFVQLSDRIDSKIQPLSGGMKRRVTIARSLMSEPDILLLDEPTTGLDPQARHVLWDRLYRLKQRGVTLVLTTHYMDEAEQLCDRLVVMDQGRIVAEGSPAELIRTHAPREVLELRFPLAPIDDIPAPSMAAASSSTGPINGSEPGTAEHTVGAEQAAAIEGVGARQEVLPDRILIYADDGESALSEVHRRGGNPESALVRRSTLEDVFLRLTGRTLVD